ncbi:MAG: hypothetical protein EB039_07695 [Proteobacteria bacterium]|nr:hypothetical protein [Pseudomonadota bacterium]
MPQAEEVAKGCHDTGMRLTIPVHAHHHLAVVVGVGHNPVDHGAPAILRHPDMGDAPWPLDIGESDGLPRSDHPWVSVASGVIPTG